MKNGSGLYAAIYEIVRDIPPGRVACYGQVASFLDRCSARQVGYAMHALPKGSDVPWQRVINSRGTISLPGETGARQRRLLEAEGIEFDGKGRIDLAVYGWRE